MTKNWRDGYTGCYKCGVEAGKESTTYCVDSAPHWWGWRPLPNPAFDTPEMRKLMRLRLGGTGD